MTVEAWFPQSPASIAAARRFVSGVLVEARADRELRDRAELMVSELATNAVRHARTAFCISVVLGAKSVRIDVADSGAGRPRSRRPAPDEPTGRGLWIVESMADNWGVDDTDDGKVVWFSLAASSRRGSTSSARAGAPPGRR